MSWGLAGAEPLTILGIDINVLIKQVRAIAEEFPDFRYKSKLRPMAPSATQWEESMLHNMPLAVDNGCRYKEADGTAGCIIGHAFNMLGVLDQITDLTNKTGITALTLLSNGMAAGSVHSDPRVLWLRAVQTQQDKGRPWGQAVRMADHRVPSIKRDVG